MTVGAARHASAYWTGVSLVGISGFAIGCFISTNSIENISSELIGFFALMAGLLTQLIALSATMIDLSRFPSATIDKLRTAIEVYQGDVKRLFMLFIFSVILLLILKIYPEKLSGVPEGVPLVFRQHIPENWYAAIIVSVVFLSARATHETISTVIALHRERMDLERRLSEGREREIKLRVDARITELFDAMHAALESGQKPSHIRPLEKVRDINNDKMSK